MPEPGQNEKQDEFISRCIKVVMDDGTASDSKQAAAICYSKWREKDKGKSIALSVTFKINSGDPAGERVRWKAIANSGEFDQQGDRFDMSFFDDIAKNFWGVQDAMSRGMTPLPGYAHPDGMPIPQLDVSHYSFQFQKSDRFFARVGVPTNTYIDGIRLIMQGYFETTPIGNAASKSVLADDKDIIKTSVGVWPDWDRVETQPDGRRVFKGGAGVAYLDHLALTAYPVDAKSDITAEGQPMEKSLTVADDALQVLQDPELVRQLEEARAKVKSGADVVPDGAIVKADDISAEAEPVVESVVTVTTEHSDKTVTTVEKDAAADAIETGNTPPEQPASQAEPQPDNVEMSSIKKAQSENADALKVLADRVDALSRSLPDLGALRELATALTNSIEATKATEARKVKSMLDNGGWLNLAELYSPRSATDNTIDGGARAKGPQETEPNAQAGGPIAGRFIRT